MTVNSSWLKATTDIEPVKGRNKNHGVSTSKASRNRYFYGGQSGPLIGVMIQYARGPIQEKLIFSCIGAPRRAELYVERIPFPAVPF